MAGSEKKKADDLLQEGYAKYYTAIYRYALSRLGDPHKSEDVAQEAFVIYYKRLTFEEYSRQISAALSDTDAALFSMRYIEDLKIEDIAARMDMSVPAVTTRLHRLRKKLREILNQLF